MKPNPDNCDENEMEVTRLICEGLAPLAPPADEHRELRRRLLARAGRSIAAEAGLRTVRVRDGAWRPLNAGIRVKPLWNGPGGRSVLIEMRPGARLPAHRHASLEEGIVLAGGFQLDGLEFGPGDYHASPRGSRHGRITSRQGVLAYLRGTSLGHAAAMIGELIGGWLPGAGDAPVTVRADERGWQQWADGVDSKLLWRDGETDSRFVRLQAGAGLPSHVHGGDEECMVVTGDAFIGDLLVGAGDFHLAPAGTVHGPVVSEHGALLFIRGSSTGMPIG